MLGQDSTRIQWLHSNRLLQLISLISQQLSASKAPYHANAAPDSMMEHDRACKSNQQSAISVNCNPLTLFALSFLKRSSSAIKCTTMLVMRFARSCPIFTSHPRTHMSSVALCSAKQLRPREWLADKCNAVYYAEGRSQGGTAGKQCFGPDDGSTHTLIITNRTVNRLCLVKTSQQLLVSSYFLVGTLTSSSQICYNLQNLLDRPSTQEIFFLAEPKRA